MRTIVRLAWVLLLLAIASPAGAQPMEAAGPAAPVASSAPSDAEIRQLLINRIDVQKQSVGIVIGVIEPQGRRVVAYGSLETGDTRPLDGDTLFEIGSITKVFTALLAADMAQRGEITLDAPIAHYLPPEVKVPERHGQRITAVDLATHTSGLPRMPGNFRPKDPANPYVDYSTEQLYAFLSSYELIRDIGVKFEYSNLGFGLLGQALAHRAGTDYATLVERRICGPLGMPSTRITLSPDMRRRLAAGHNADLVTVPAWDIPVLAGAGALRSSANDLLLFLAANLGYTDTPLAPAMQALRAVKRPGDQPFVDAGLGWIIDTRGGNEIIWKNGGTGGYRTFIGYAPRSRIGIVALSNTSSKAGVDDLGLHLLDARFPLDVPAGSPKVASVDPERLERYVGRYELSPNFILTVTRDGGQLSVQATNQLRYPVYATSDREFFYKAVNAQITFETDAEGQATSLVLHQNGRDQPARRIDEATARHLEEAIAKRFKDQTPQPGSEASIRHQIDELQQGQPHYEQFTPALAAQVRRQAPATQALIAKLGALQSVTFKSVGPGGADIYEVQFANGTLEWRIFLGPDGKVAVDALRTLP